MKQDMESRASNVFRQSSKRHKIAVIDGPNVSNLKHRSNNMYGPSMSAETLHEMVRQWSVALEIDVEIFMSNYEGAILEFIHDASQRVDGIIINPAGLTAQSIGVPHALHDTGLPVVEVHFANVAASADRGGSVCLNSFERFAKWISASIMLPPSSVSAR